MAKKYIPPPQSLANLRPWKPGDPSPNPGGRPKKRPVTDRYYERGEGPLPEIQGTQRKEVTFRVIFEERITLPNP
jgi:hypothetical protein